MAYEPSQGILFKFNNAPYTATSISVSKSNGEFNATGTEIPKGNGCLSRYRAGGLVSLDIKVDWIGATLPPTDNVYPINFEGGGAGNGIHGNTPGFGSAICTALTLTAQAGELIKGSATFKVSID